MKNRSRTLLTVAWLLVLSGLPGFADEPQSASYRIEAGTFGLGGAAGGVEADPGTYRLSLHSLGMGGASGAGSAAGFTVQAGIGPVYAPAAEVEGVRVDPSAAVTWQPAAGATSYRLYRGTLGAPDSATCLTSGITGLSAGSGATPAPATGFYYLVAAVDRLGGEGTSGTASDGQPRSSPPCP